MTTVLGVTVPVKASETYRDTWSDQYELIFTALGNEAATKTVDLVGSDKNFSRMDIKDCSETAYSLGNISGAVTVDYTNGHWQYGTVTGNITSLTITNPPATGHGGFLTLELLQGSVGSYTIDLTAGTTYRAAGGTYTYTTTLASSSDFFFRTRDAGTTWRFSVSDNISAV